MVGYGLACPGVGVPECRGASLGGRGWGGFVGAKIRRFGVSGRGGGVLGYPYHMGGVITRNTEFYIYNLFIFN